MKLFEQVKNDRIVARKARNQIVSSVLTTLVGELEVQAKRTGTEVTDEMVMSACKKFVLNNTETIKLVASDLAKATLVTENTALNLYLPTQMSADALRTAISSSGASSLAEIMKHLKETYAGKYDGKVASAVAKEFV